MPLDLACPGCGEGDDLSGATLDGAVVVTCGGCGLEWVRDTEPRCTTCGSTDVRAVTAAIVEKGRGTQLSVVGTRLIHLCPTCDHAALVRYLANLPNPLMPDEMPNAPGERP